jgi:CRP-like cAMP-binding protein
MSDQLDYGKLRSLTIFKDLDSNELEIVRKHVFEQRVKKDSVLFREGMPGELLYIIMSGCVEIIKETKDHEKIVLATMKTNEIIGEMSLIDSEPRSATGITLEDSVLLVIQKQSFNEILQSDPYIAAKILKGLLKIIIKRLRIADKKIEEIKIIVRKKDIITAETPETMQ